MALSHLPASILYPSESACPACCQTVGPTGRMGGEFSPSGSLEHTGHEVLSGAHRPCSSQFGAHRPCSSQFGAHRPCSSLPLLGDRSAPGPPSPCSYCVTPCPGPPLQSLRDRMFIPPLPSCLCPSFSFHSGVFHPPVEKPCKRSLPPPRKLPEWPRPSLDS